jgi:hypothetical protein
VRKNEIFKFAAACLVFALSVISFAYQAVAPDVVRADPPNGQCVVELFCCDSECSTSFCADYCFYPYYYYCMFGCLGGGGGTAFCEDFCSDVAWDECGADCTDAVCANYPAC